MLTRDAGWHLLDSGDCVKGRKALHLPGLLERNGKVSFLLKTERKNICFLPCYLKPYGLKPYGFKAFICFVLLFKYLSFLVLWAMLFFPRRLKSTILQWLGNVVLWGGWPFNLFIKLEGLRESEPCEPSANKTQLLGVAFIHLTVSVHHWCHLETPEQFPWGTGRLELVSYWWTGLGQWTNTGPGAQEWNAAVELLCYRTGRDTPSSWSYLQP